MEICKECTGCMSCFNSCQFNAINIVQDEKGFYIPKVDKTKCKNCELCKKVCPQNNNVLKHDIINVYAAWSKDKKDRMSSSSGGIASVISKFVIENGGVVFGAVFDDKFKVYHKCIKTIEELDKLKGSKYVQSFIGSSFLEVKKELEEGRIVLFTGTACQISGLYSFLNKKYNNLITVDVLCHGVPSPKFLSDYLEHMEKNKIGAINFKYKKPSWTKYSMKIQYKDKIYQNTKFKDKYLRAFSDDYIINESCFNCNYVGKQRVSDITVADFWGYVSENKKYKNTEKGISLVLINTNKGCQIFNKIKNNIIFIEKTFDEASEGNQPLRKRASKNKKYDEFWIDYINYGYEYVSNTYITKSKDKIKRKVSRFFNNNAYLIPLKMRNKLIKIRKNTKK